MLAKTVDLYLRLFAACSNGVIPTLKLVQCLQKMHLAKPIYFESRDQVTVWAPNAGAYIRMIASHFRLLAESPDKLRQCLKKVFWSLVCK